MAYIPGCGADVFISYAHRDNLDGWISRLRSKLAEKLNPFLAGHAEVWFDDRLAPGVYFREEIQQKLKNTPIFVAVVSPSYLDSEFSIVHELDWFQNQGGRDIIQLLKAPLLAGQEVPLPKTQYKLFYKESDGSPLEGRAQERAMDEVVAAIHRTLRELWEIRPKIYVSQLRNEAWKPQWDELREYMHSEGYAILPKGILPVRVPDGRIREWLEGALLSMHLADIQNDPLAQRQFEIAAQTGRPVVIIPAPLARNQFPAIASEVRSQLESARKPTVYLIYDYHSDHGRVATLPEIIRQKTGCDVFLPAAGETYHKFRLQVSEGVLLFRSEAPEEWLKSQEESLVQAAAGRDRRKIAEAKYFVHKPNGHAIDVRRYQGARQEWIIERTGDFDVNDLQSFFDALHARVQNADGVSS